MTIAAGYNSKVNLTGTAVTFVGEGVSTSDNTVYQITDSDKNIFGKESTVRVHKESSTGNIAEAGTTTTNIELTGHGLVAGDLIFNTTRNARRLVEAVVDVNNITVSGIASQTSGDSINFYPTEDPTTYTLNRLFGKITYPGSASRTLRVSGEYLPSVEVAQAREIEISLSANNEDVSVFGNAWVQRAQNLLDLSASLSKFREDATYQGHITNGELKVLEWFIDRTSDVYLRAWVIYSSVDGSSSVDSTIEESIELEGVTDADGRTVSLNT